MDYQRRSQWGARTPSDTLEAGTLKRGIGVHWEAAEAPRDHARCDDVMRQIQSYHMNAKGWDDIAYNWLVCYHGIIYEGRGWGKRSAANGYPAVNDSYHAVCAFGDSEDDFSPEQRDSVRAVILENQHRGHGTEVRPHSYFRATQCPGNAIRNWIAAGYPGTKPVPVGETTMRIIDPKNGHLYLWVGDTIRRIPDPPKFYALAGLDIPVKQMPLNEFNWAFSVFGKEG